MSITANKTHTKYHQSTNFLWLVMCLLMLPWCVAMAAEPVPVAVQKVDEQIVNTDVILTGTVTSPNVSGLSVSVAGLVKNLHVEEGDYVAAGDVLLGLDKELVAFQLQQTNAQKDEARVALADARRRLQEAQRLAAQKNIAATTVKDREAEVAVDEAVYTRAQASAAYQAALLQRHDIRAPFAGVIAERHIDVGEWVTPGASVFTLVATQGLRLDFSVAETYLDKIQVGAVVTFSLAGESHTKYTGRVTTLVPVTDPNARTFLLRVALDNNREHNLPVNLLPGMSVQANLQVSSGREGIVVPRDAVLRYPDGRVVVWEIVDGDAGPVAQERVVELGAVADGMVEVRSGLSQGASIVVQGNEGLRQGQQVKIVDNVLSATLE